MNKKELMLDSERLLNKATFTREDASRTTNLLALAGLLKENEVIERKAWRPFHEELRDLATDTGTGGYLVPLSFAEELSVALKGTDRLFDPSFHWHLETDRGSPMTVPIIDDTQCAAVAVSQGGTFPGNANTPPTEQDPAIGAIQFPVCPTYRTGVVKVSIELAQDSKFPMEQVLAAAFAIRFARGIGPVLVSSILSEASQGAIASGDPNHNYYWNGVEIPASDNGSISIGYEDLIALKKSLNPAYRQAGAAWLMNDDTLNSLQALTSTTGQPLLNMNDRVLLGFPIGPCPSMTDIAPGAKPLIFYCPRYFVVRFAAMPSIQILTERYAPNGQIGFQAFLRVQGSLFVPANGPCPAVYLQNSATT